MAALHDDIAVIATELRLPRLEGAMQDWGIECSDPYRVDEFVRYYVREHDRFGVCARRELIDLVLESADGALEDGLPCDLDGLRRAFIAADPERLEYWRSLEVSAADPWPVVEHLRAWKG